MASRRSAVLFLTSLFIFCSLCKNATGITWPTLPSPKFPGGIPRKAPPVNPFCPRDTLKLGACLDLLGDMAKLVAGVPPVHGCCALLEGLTNAEAAACLCTTIKESVLGITTEWSVALSLMVSPCKKAIPDGFKCI